MFNSSWVYAFENITLPAQNSEISTPVENESQISKEEFDVLEKKIFKKTFDSDISKNRLERLEKEIFGMVQKGNEEERFENLITASEYYTAGYRQNQSNSIVRTENSQGHDIQRKINPKDYIVNYNFDDSDENEDIIPYSAVGQPYSSKSIPAEPVKKRSKFMQFLSDVADALSTGVVTGYTVPINDFDIDTINGINTFGDNNYIGLPQSTVHYPRNIGPYYRHPYYPYATRSNNRYPSPRYNYIYNPYGSGRRNYQSGSGVKIIR